MKCTNRFEKGGIRLHLFPHRDNNKELHDKWIASNPFRKYINYQAKS